MTTRRYDDEFAAIAADDALLDALGWTGFGSSDEPEIPMQASAGNGSAIATDDAIAVMLGVWRHELDIAAHSTPAPRMVVVPPPSEAALASRRGWMRRHTAGIAVASVVLAVGSTGVAAAQSGRSGPFAAVHRVLFGTPAHDDTAALARVTALLEGVAADLGDARAAGGATAAQLSDMGDRLDTAGRILAADPAAPAALTARLAELRADLATIDTLPTTPPTVGSDGSARNGDTGSGASGSPAEGDRHDSGSANGDGQDTSGTSGSDGTTTSDGGGGSGDGATSDSGSTGSGDGSVSNDSSTSDSSTSDSGSSSDAGSTSSDGSTSDGGTTGSDGGTTSDSGTSGSDGGT